MVLNFIKEVNGFKKNGKAYKACQKKNYSDHIICFINFPLMKQ